MTTEDAEAILREVRLVQENAAQIRAKAEAAAAAAEAKVQAILQELKHANDENEQVSIIARTLQAQIEALKAARTQDSARFAELEARYREAGAAIEALIEKNEELRAGSASISAEMRQLRAQNLRASDAPRAAEAPTAAAPAAEAPPAAAPAADAVIATYRTGTLALLNQLAEGLVARINKLEPDLHLSRTSLATTGPRKDEGQEIKRKFAALEAAIRQLNGNQNPSSDQIRQVFDTLLNSAHVQKSHRGIWRFFRIKSKTYGEISDKRKQFNEALAFGNAAQAPQGNRGQDPNGPVGLPLHLNR
jgi:hypothetical protein